MVMSNDVLVAIVLFVFMGYLIERGGVLDRLFHSILLAAGRLRGSLAITTLITCTLFAMATGIIGASVSLMALLALPAMLRLNYDKGLATGTIAAGGTLGILIPPSVLLILYAANAGVSIVRLYAAAFVPGLILTGLFLLYVVIVTWRRPHLGPPLPKEERDVPPWRIAGMVATGVLPLALLVTSVLGSIAFGLAAPTEAAAMGAAGALLLKAAYRKMTWESLKEAVFQSIRTSSMVLTLLVGSAIFSGVFATLGSARVIEQFLMGLGLSAAGFVWLTLILIFLLGWPLEWTEIIIIFMPLAWPIAEAYNIDPIWLGVLVAVNLQTAFLTPPVAMAAFYIKGVAPPSVLLSDIWRGMLPFVGLQMVGLLLVYFFPQIALWLPSVLIR
jgi:tripartite ATP-independent transporter DctM subunit